ncbi:CHAT domain-containing protein [Kamptonema sp. UHCC 0994]|uniref:CHAT domain-containing protein n=1 Tax=Kamptonema sp. UHCC 0994 TaxID=3031329 RepID=UPI0023B96DD4|nr:CHAT domain-containing protein [Kamptonema sp. UHCC 0994]MDF0552586.1 CHAT domain-containing protein [Kamptonema sp. UHCC 0994]
MWFQKFPFCSFDLCFLQFATIKADALRFAQIAMLKGEVRVENGQLVTNTGKFDLPSALKSQDSTDFTHPYYWSGFTLVGNPW